MTNRAESQQKIDSLQVGTKLKCIRDQPLIIGQITVGTIITIRHVGEARGWFCSVRWTQPWQGSTRTMRAVLKASDMASFEVVPRKVRRSPSVQSDLPLSMPLQGLEDSAADEEWPSYLG